MPLPSAPEIADSQGNQQGHETILQMLNRKIGDDYFPVESFENAASWDGIPIVFAAEHPDLEAFEKDPVAELKRIAEKTGRRADIVGTLTNSRIEQKGHTRLMSDLVLNDDPEVFQLYEAGKLSGSTGFWATTEAGSLKGSVLPNHFLLFEEDMENQPRDKGVVILNKQSMKAFTNEGRVIATKNKTKFQELLDGLRSLFDDMTGGTGQDPPSEPVTNAVTAEPEQIEPETLPAEPKTNMTDEIVASKDAEIASLKEILQKEQEAKTELANKIAEIEAASKDAAWKALKNKLPPGLVHTPEKEAETRELFEKDSFAFTNLILEKKTGEPGKEAGEQFTQKEDKNDPVAIGRELRLSTGRIR